MSAGDLEGGRTARLGLYDAAALARAAEVLEEVQRRGLEVVRLSFVDQHGILRGKALAAAALASAFRSGVAMTSTLLLKDTSHRTVFPVWEGGPGIGDGRLNGAGDMLMLPDPETFRVLPWSQHNGWMLCDLRYADGGEMPFCPRSILKRSVARLAADVLRMTCGLEVEFHVHRVEDARLAHADAGMPGAPPETALLAQGYQYLTEARYDALEEAMDAIRRASQKLGLPVRSMEVEFGPSQCEMTFEPADPLSHADAMVLFRHATKEVCRRMGLHASFMSRPRLEGVVPCGWHLHQSVGDAGGRNLFAPEGEGLTPTASGWIAGLLERAEESCMLTTPTVNGYKRYQPFMLAPDRIQWGRDNKGAMIRALIAPGDAASRVENRVAEPAACPHLVFAAQIEAGRDGVARGLPAPEPVEDPYGSDAPRLPADLGAAVDAFEASDLWPAVWGADTVRWLSRIKRAEWRRYLATVSEWEQREYYGLF